MSSSEVRELLRSEPFEPFRIRLSSGGVYSVRDPQSVALMKTRILLALPGGDGWVFIPYLHIAALESGKNGRAPGSRRKRA